MTSLVFMQQEKYLCTAVTRPGAHGAVGAALAAPTFCPKMGVSTVGVSDDIVHLFFYDFPLHNYRSSMSITI